MTDLLEHVLRHGASTVSFQVLEPGYRVFEREEGVVAYVDTGLAWVAAGEPLCEPAHAATLARAFCDAALRARRVSCLFATEARFAREAAAVGLASTLVGEQPVFHPARWATSLRAHKSLREQLRRARAKGVRVRRVEPAELASGSATRARIHALLERWVAGRRMATMAFLVQLDPFRHLEHEVVFVAERDEDVVGYLGVVPVPVSEGWFLEDLIRDRRAPNGTAEALFDAAMREAATLGVPRATLGLAPLSGPIPRPLARIRDLTRFLYDFRGLRRFKEKLDPVGFEPVYVSYPRRQGAVVALLASLHAFAGGRFFVFGLRTLGRRPKLAVFVVLAFALFVAMTTTFALHTNAP